MNPLAEFGVPRVGSTQILRGRAAPGRHEEAEALDEDIGGVSLLFWVPLAACPPVSAGTADAPSSNPSLLGRNRTGRQAASGTQRGRKQDGDGTGVCLRPRSEIVLTLLAILLASQPGCARSPQAMANQPPPTVVVTQARKMTVPIQASANGTTRALKQVSIRARVRGFLQEIHFTEGADVKSGQLLFVIEEEPFQAALDAARAQLAEARANLAKAKQSKAREVATAQLAVSEAQASLARAEETRVRTLLNRGASPREELDRVQANLKRAEAQVEADRANLEQVKADYDVNIQSAQATVDNAQAAVRQAEINLSYCRMYAPIDGRIGEAKVKVGNLVGPGPPAGQSQSQPQGSSSSTEADGGGFTELATIQQLDPMGVDVQVSSRYLERAARLIRQGLQVRLMIQGTEGEQEYPHLGKALFLDNTINPATSTFLIRNEVPNPDKTLLPGEYVQVHVIVGQIENAVVVPEEAVVDTQAGQLVYLVNRQGKVEARRVRATTTYNGLRAVESGLEGGETVIVEGLQMVRAGMEVRTEPMPEPAQPQAQAKTAQSGGNP